jgi:two-component SAPR family response regulator
VIKESRIDSKTSSSGIASRKEDKYWKRILIVDDEVDITTTLKLIIENANETSSRRIVVDTYNDPRLALLDFEPNLYDLLLIDINMPYMDGFKLSEKILDIDLNVKICYMSAGEISHDALREIHPSISLGCFIIKPVSNDYLIGRIIAELD